MIRLRFIAPALFTLIISAPLSASDCPRTLEVTKRYLASDERVRLCDAFAGKVLLVVNTASYCGFTQQYDGLEKLYETYRDRGLVVLGFPSNDFMQEPGSEKKVQQFCRLTYSIEFPMFEKTNVSSSRAGPLYNALAEEAGEYPRWNFHKYLLDRSGRVVASFGSRVRPQNAELVDAIESLL
ncbi:MAG: glutathione peroxidase [Pseudomonadota bacterium]|jgi:glutathione peroxidase|nr:glutathione peroxidase [Pseudomonadota bacterium]